MKKFLKNSILAMLVICFILNIVNVVNLVVEHHKITRHLEEAAQIVADQVLSNEEIYNALASFYGLGYGNKDEIQLGIIGLSMLFGTVTGLMVTFEKKSKTKFILGYILGFLLISIILTLFHMTQEKSFFSELLYNIESLWKWYTLIFVIIYVVKIYISNKKTQKLNEFLENKKSKDNK